MNTSLECELSPVQKRVKEKSTSSTVWPESTDARILLSWRRQPANSCRMSPVSFCRQVSPENCHQECQNKTTITGLIRHTKTQKKQFQLKKKGQRLQSKYKVMTSAKCFKYCPSHIAEMTKYFITPNRMMLSTSGSQRNIFWGNKIRYTALLMGVFWFSSYDFQPESPKEYCEHGLWLKGN